jgi:hypothetical protein
MLSVATIRKVMRESFTTQENDLREIISIGYGHRQAWFNKLVQRLKTMERVEAHIWASEEDDKCSLELGVIGPSKGRNPHDDFAFSFETRNDTLGLWIESTSRRKHGTEKPGPYPVFEVRQIFEFVEKIKTIQERNHLRDRRKEKIASLQQTGLTSRLKELGVEHDFAFAMSQTARDVRLSIRLGGRKRGYHFTFPKGKLASVIEQIPDLIKTLKELQSLGVAFRSENKHWRAKQGKWIEPPKKAKVKEPKSRSTKRAPR